MSSCRSTCSENTGRSMIHKLQKCPGNSSKRERDRKRIAGSLCSALRAANRLRSRIIFNEKNRWPARFPQCVPHYVWIRLTIALDERITDLKGKIWQGLPYHFSSVSARIWIAPRETRNANGIFITRLVRATYCTLAKTRQRSVFSIRYQNIAEKCRNRYRQKNKEEKLSRGTRRELSFQILLRNVYSTRCYVKTDLACARSINRSAFR